MISLRASLTRGKLGSNAYFFGDANDLFTPSTKKLKIFEIPLNPTGTLVKPFFLMPSHNNLRNRGFLNSGLRLGDEGLSIL